MTKDINLTPRLEEMVRQKTASGLYTSASEVSREALRLMQAQDQLRAAQLTRLHQAIPAGRNSGQATARYPTPLSVTRASAARPAIAWDKYWPIIIRPCINTDLIKIKDNIADDSTARVDKFIDDIDRVFYKLARKPTLGRWQDKLAKDLRSFP